MKIKLMTKKLQVYKCDCLDGLDKFCEYKNIERKGFVAVEWGGINYN